MLCRRTRRTLRLRPLARAAQVASSSNAHPHTQPQPPQSCSQRRRPASTTTTTTTPFPSNANPKVIFSGIQPTGVPHLGNYLGALSQWVALQEVATAANSGGGGTTTPTRLLFSVVDLHAITLPQEAAQLRRWRREMLAALLAVGLDPARSTIFHQSSVPAHAELMWVLSCTASMGYLSRMTQWKSKMSLPDDASALPGDDNGQGGGSNNKSAAALKLGLFSYPVLQAADILVHRATHVPVGDDQRQHLEFARECAAGFNHTYGGGGRGAGVLVPPETIVSPARRVMSLTDPTKKMSKSDANAASRVLITDAPGDIKKKIMRAVTDSESGFVSYDPAARPGVSNLLEILAILGKGERRTPEEVAGDFAASQHPLKVLKERTAQAVIAELRDVRERYMELLGSSDGKELDEIEAAGAEKARASADATMKLVKDAVGF